MIPDAMSSPVPPPASSGTPARVAFVTTTPLSIAGGSGTYVGITRLASALRGRAIRVDLHSPARSWRTYTAQRILFNLRVARRLREIAYDWVIGFDLDGFHYGRRPVAPYIASIKGVIADELRNERGVVRAVLALQARLEALAVRRARVVVATSDYSRRQIGEAYRVPTAKIVVVPEPIDLHVWELEERPAKAEPPAILSVAHLYPRKNLGVLLHAYGLLRQAGRPFQASSPPRISRSPAAMAPASTCRELESKH